jgi:hypothetical protein
VSGAEKDDRSIGRALAAGVVSLGVLGLGYLLFRPAAPAPVASELADASIVERVAFQQLNLRRDAASPRDEIVDASMAATPADSASQHLRTLDAAATSTDASAPMPVSTAPVPKALRIPAQTVLKFAETQSARRQRRMVAWACDFLVCRGRAYSMVTSLRW